METPSPQRLLYLDCAPFTGGAQESLLTLMEGVAARGWEPVLVSADRSAHGLLERGRERGWRGYALRTSHWRASPVGAVRLGLERLAAIRVIHAAIAETTPVLIHANGARSGLLLPGDAWKTQPVILHDRDLRLPGLALGWLARQVRQVLATSRCVAAKWTDRLPAERVRVIPNGFDLERLSATVPTSGLAMPGVHTWAVLVADLEPWKRHDVFLEAVAKASDAETGLAAALVGRARTAAAGRYLQRLRESAAQLGMADRVRFVTDAVSALPWLAAADVVVSGALEEPFGRTVVEALALGKPVVAVNACGPGEILAGCPAATLTGSSPIDLAAGIRAWLDPARRAAAREPAMAWAARYDRDRMVDAVCALYREILSAGETSPAHRQRQRSPA